MSVSSNSRKESTESNAAQAMHSPMGLHPEQGLAQLNDKGLENELPSRVADSSDTDVPGDVADAENTVAEADGDTKVADADWNRSTSEGVIPATRTNEPDRTLGNS